MMNLTNSFPTWPAWLDALFISFFHFPFPPVAAFVFGCTILAVICVLLGALTYNILFLLNHKYYTALDDAMVKSHNLTVDALHAGNTEAYRAVNTVAHEHFGKSFFARAALGISALWPVPFALAWLALRFEGVPIVILPFMERALGYPFVFLALYILTRILFSRISHRLPFFRKAATLRQEAGERRGPARSLFK